MEEETTNLLKLAFKCKKQAVLDNKEEETTKVLKLTFKVYLGFKIALIFSKDKLE